MSDAQVHSDLVTPLNTKIDEELLACYPEKWAEEVKNIAAAPVIFQSLKRQPNLHLFDILTII